MSVKKNELPVEEELDFAYLLELMPPLHDVAEFAWLPELFTILGHEKFLRLCKYAGGETIRIPTLKELSSSIDVLQLYYDIMISKKKDISAITDDVCDKFMKVCEIYNARNREVQDT